MSRKGDWLQTYSGGKFYPLDPRPEEVVLADIAHALANICRFTGHVRRFYTVAEHSILVSHAVPSKPGLALWGLLHDAAEAYIGDIGRPLKQFLFTLDKPIGPTEAKHVGCAEANILEAVAQALQLRPRPDWEAIHRADNRALATEAHALMAPLQPEWSKWLLDIPPLPASIECWLPDEAEARFLARYRELVEEMEK